MAKKKEATSESFEPSSTDALVPVVTRDESDDPLLVMTRTREEMAGRLRSLLATVRTSILSEFEMVQASVTEAALSEVAERLTELNTQLGQKSPMTIVLLPALRRKTTALEASLATLYRQTGLNMTESELAAKEAVRALVPNCPA